MNPNPSGHFPWVRDRNCCSRCGYLSGHAAWCESPEAQALKGTAETIIAEGPVSERILLNVGSGQRPAGKPWINVDIQPRWNPDLLADVSKLPHGDNTVEAICAHHVLEHLVLDDGAVALREWLRVLKSGGSLLIFVPDLAALAKKWLSGGITDYIYAVNLYGAFMGDPADRHRWGWCYRSLHAMLTEAGFRTIKLFDWREIEGADIAGPDFWILAVEAIK